MAKRVINFLFKKFEFLYSGFYFCGQNSSSFKRNQVFIKPFSAHIARDNKATIFKRDLEPFFSQTTSPYRTLNSTDKL